MIDSFSGNFRFLSNFWPASVEFAGVRYPSVEHAYVAAKTTDLDARKAVRNMTAGQAKRFGRGLTLREDWDSIKLSVMEDLVRQKFLFNPQARELLLSTGTQELVEGNTWGDTFWGVYKGRGENHLGKILMKIRKEAVE